MFPSVTILGLTISTYGLMIALGLIAVVLYFRIYETHFPVPPADAELAMIFGAVGAFIGAKILYLLTVLPQLIKDVPYLLQDPNAFFNTYLFSGFVFYGGFYGAWATVALYCKIEHLNLWDMMRALIPTVPLIHFFGRIGCFMAGCCYGIESPTFGIVFRNSEIAPNNMPLFPVQLMEATGELILFFLLLKLVKKTDSGQTALSTWLIGYGIMRFILEFCRGDSYRGFLGMFSISQIIALISIMVGCSMMIHNNKIQNCDTSQTA